MVPWPGLTKSTSLSIVNGGVSEWVESGVNAKCCAHVHLNCLTSVGCCAGLDLITTHASVARAAQDSNLDDWPGRIVIVGYGLGRNAPPLDKEATHLQSTMFLFI